MDRRGFLAMVTGSIAAVAGCSSSDSTTQQPPATETKRETVHAGPAVNVHFTEDPTISSPTTPVDETTTESVTATPPPTGPTESDPSGSSHGGGGGGGSGGSGTSVPATSTPTVTSEESESDHPIHLTISTMTMNRIVGDLACTDGPLAWMAVEIEYLRDGEKLESIQEKMEAPDTDDTLSFEVESETSDHNSLRITTAYTHPDENR